MATPVMILAHVAEQWKDAYAASRVLGVTVVFGHLGALLIGGGVAVSTDLATLRAFRSGSAERIRQLGVVRASHRIVIAALSVLFVTGVLLLASDLDAFWGSPWLGMKLAFVTLLVINGAVLFRTSETLLRARANTESLWRRLRTVSVLSIVLWLGTVLAGTILQNAA